MTFRLKVSSFHNLAKVVRKLKEKKLKTLSYSFCLSLSLSLPFVHGSLVADGQYIEEEPLRGMEEGKKCIRRDTLWSFPEDVAKKREEEDGKKSNTVVVVQHVH